MKKLIFSLMSMAVSLGSFAFDFDYDNIFLIGNATPSGWDNPGTTRMTRVEGTHVYQWTGTLQPGTFKVKSGTDDSWDQDHFWFADSLDGSLRDGVAASMHYGQKDDHQWTITEGVTTTVTVNLDNNTVTLGDVYEIATLEQLQNFADSVNKGQTGRCARLTADISDEFTGVIGFSNDTENNMYRGYFDGQNHYLTLAIDREVKVNPEDETDTLSRGQDNVGLFGIIDGAVLKNLVVKGYVKGNNHTAGLVGASFGDLYFINCGNEAAVWGKNNTAGLLGCAFGGKVRMENVYNCADVTGTGESAAFCGWTGNDAIIRNAYHWGNLKGLSEVAEGKYSRLYRAGDNAAMSNLWDICDDQATGVYSLGDMQKGKLCYELGSAFTEDLSQEAQHPAFGGLKVDGFSVSETKYATWVTRGSCLAGSLPEGVEACTATVSNNTVLTHKLAAETMIPTGAVLLLKSETPQESYFNAGSETGTLEGNWLEVAAEDITVSDDCHFVLSTDAEVTGFYRVAQNTEEAPSVITRGTVYLYVEGTEVPGFLPIVEGTTGIEEVQGGEMVVPEGSKWFNLAGQRVAGSAKGIIVTNGQKVVR